MPDIQPESFVNIAEVTTREKVEIPEVVGGRGPRGRGIELQTTATHLQWRVADATPAAAWQNLIALADLEGQPGAPGEQVEIGVSATHIQWRYADGAWTDLVDLAALQGGPGATGPAGTVTIGTVTTSEPGGEASVTNSGTDTAAILDIVIPRGSAGTPGTNGESAFQLAQADGFTGTVAEWLDSLNGEDGAAATITIGTVTTGEPGTEVTVTNSGTETNVVLDITIPRGATGDAGVGVPDATGAPAGQVPVTDGTGGYVLGEGGGGSGTGINPRGEWSEITAYEAGDSVRLGNREFVAISDSVGEEPGQFGGSSILDHLFSNPPETPATNSGTYYGIVIETLNDMVLSGFAIARSAVGGGFSASKIAAAGSGNWNQLDDDLVASTGASSPYPQDGDVAFAAFASPVELPAGVYTFAFRSNQSGNLPGGYSADADADGVVLLGRWGGGSATLGGLPADNYPSQSLVFIGPEVKWRHTAGLPAVTDLTTPSHLTLPTSQAVVEALAEKPDHGTPDPSTEPDGRMLYTEAGELVYGDAPTGGGGLGSTTLTAINTTEDPAQEPGEGELLVVLPTPRVVAVANSAITYGGADSITSISATVPMDVEEGDTILALVGSAPYAITPPAGYSLVTTVAGTGSTTFMRVASAYASVATGAEAGSVVTFSMASAGRMSLTLVIVRSGTRSVGVEDHAEVAYTASANPGQHPIPSVVSAGPGRLAVAFCSCAYIISAGTTTVTIPDGWTPHTPTSVSAPPTHSGLKSWVMSRALSAGEDTATVSQHHLQDHDSGNITLVLASS